MSTFSETKVAIDATAVTTTYRDGYVPDDAVFPYASILDPVSDAVLLSGDARTIARRRLLQVDLWQREGAEDVTLPDTIANALDGLNVTDGMRLRHVDTQRIPEAEDDVVHHALTLSVVRLR